MSAGPAVEESPARRVAVTVARLALTVAPLAYLVARVDLHLVARSIARASAPLLLVWVLLQVAYMVVVAQRWRTLASIFMPPGSAQPSIASLVVAYLVAAYASFLPVAGAGEAALVWRTRHLYTGSAVTSFGVVAIERLVGLLGTMLLGALGWYGATDESHRILASTLGVGALGAAALAALFIVLPTMVRRVGRLSALLARHPRVGAWIGRLPLVTDLRDLALPLALSVVAQLVSVAMTSACFAALGEPLPVLAVMRVQPLLMIALAVPVTPAGIGQREFAFVTLFGLAGASRAVALGVALLAFALHVAQALAGLAALVVERRGSRGA